MSKLSGRSMHCSAEPMMRRLVASLAARLFLSFMHPIGCIVLTWLFWTIYFAR